MMVREGFDAGCGCDAGCVVLWITIFHAAQETSATSIEPLIIIGIRNAQFILVQPLQIHIRTFSRQTSADSEPSFNGIIILAAIFGGRGHCR